MDRRTFLISLAASAAAFACASTPGVSEASPAHGVSVPGRPDAILRTPEEWRARLTPEQFNVLFEGGTERAFTGKYWDNHVDGTYVCAACELPLFDSAAKFESGTGWPSFFQPLARDVVAEVEDRSWIYVRTEVRCDRCGGHLGHVFKDGPAPTGLRYCMNSAALSFRPRKPG